MNRQLIISFFVILAFSCDDVLESNIEDDSVTLRAPAEGLSTSTKDVTFWWDDLKGAKRYELMVVTPDRANATALIMDTVIVKNQFTLTLVEGKYEWCVKGVNDGYETELAC